MTARVPTPGPVLSAAAAAALADRKAREARALRDNLRRRKAQANAPKTDASGPAPPDDTERGPR